MPRNMTLVTRNYDYHHPLKREPLKLYNSDNIDASRLLNAIFEGAIDGIITISEIGIVEAINPAAASMFGYEPSEVIGQNVKMLMPEPYHAGHDGYIHNYKTTGEKRIIGKGREVKGKRKDGTVFPFFLSISEVNISDRRVFAGVIHDVSELKSKEKELIDSQSKFSAVIETAVDGIIIINKMGIIQMANPAVAKLFGHETKDLVQQNIKILMPNPYHREHDGYIHNYKTTGVKKIIGIGREVQGKKKSGQIFPFHLSVSEFRVDGDLFFAGIIHDLTEQKKAENEILRLNEDLEEKVKERTNELDDAVDKLLHTNSKLKKEIKEREKVEEELAKSLEKEKELGELKSRFVSTASHEFRTPLSTILSSASLIRRYETEETQGKREKHISRIKKAVNHLNGILNDFLSLSKLEEGKVEVNKEEIDWDSFTKDIIESVESILKPGQKIQLAKALKKDIFSFDSKLLKNIIINLISNAIKYSDEGKNIILGAEEKEQELLIYVKDEGIGIPEAEQEHLFSRFFRATNAINIKGTGLGLNIVMKYLELMNGGISFTSEEGKGTTFYISIPKEKV